MDFAFEFKYVNHETEPLEYETVKAEENRKTSPNRTLKLRINPAARAADCRRSFARGSSTGILRRSWRRYP